MKYLLTILTLVVVYVHVSGQSVDMKKAYRTEGTNIVLYLDNTWPRADQEKLLDKSGMKGLSLDTLWKFKSVGRWAKEGWKLSSSGKNGVKIYKSITELSGNVNWNKDVVMFNDEWKKFASQTTATYGINNFKKVSVIPTKNGNTRFFLKGNLSAQDVYLSGTFNSWSTLNTRMTKTDSGWIADIKLRPGKHCYKFIIDGQWRNDNENLNRENDYQGGFNSIYYATNHLFTLKGYQQASRVIVSGSFNNWNEKELRLQKIQSGWQLPIYIKDGTHGYKFIVDKNWITDSANPLTRDDGKGNVNSLLQIGDPYNFTLKGYPNAREVFVAGNFNGWNPRELTMTKNSVGWQLPYVLSAGNYQYKFVADGQWILDPQNIVKGIDGEHENSVVCVKPNHTFVLKGNYGARKVEVAGNFNNWTGYTMKNTTEGWMLDVYLPPGKCLYKFIVDGQWIIDPDNKLWEQNEHHTGNSVLWIEPH